MADLGFAEVPRPFGGLVLQRGRCAELQLALCGGAQEALGRSQAGRRAWVSWLGRQAADSRLPLAAAHAAGGAREDQRLALETLT